MPSIGDLYRRYTEARRRLQAANRALSRALAAEEGIVVVGRRDALLVIRRTVAEYYRVPLSVLNCRRRDQEVIEPRQVAMWFCRELTPIALQTIGRAFARDHGTVIGACRVVRHRSETEPKFAARLSEVRALLEIAFAQPPEAAPTDSEPRPSS
jgi:chromosomal replication initiator protein